MIYTFFIYYITLMLTRINKLQYDELQFFTQDLTTDQQLNNMDHSFQMDNPEADDFLGWYFQLSSNFSSFDYNDTTK
jgi:hypothetical protein